MIQVCPEALAGYTHLASETGKGRGEEKNGFLQKELYYVG